MPSKREPRREKSCDREQQSSIPEPNVKLIEVGDAEFTSPQALTVFFYWGRWHRVMYLVICKLPR